jgi:hypothetical protein
LVATKNTCKYVSQNLQYLSRPSLVEACHACWQHLGQLIKFRKIGRLRWCYRKTEISTKNTCCSGRAIQRPKLNSQQNSANLSLLAIPHDKMVADRSWAVSGPTTVTKSYLLPQNGRPKKVVGLKITQKSGCYHKVVTCKVLRRG